MANYNVLTLSEPVTDFVATTSPATINLQCGLMEDAQRKKVYAVYKAGGMPEHPYDGVRVLMSGDPLLTAVISGLTNDIEYGVRIFVEGAYGYQTALEGATARATPRAYLDAAEMPSGTPVRFPIANGTEENWRIVDVDKIYTGNITFIQDVPRKSGSFAGTKTLAYDGSNVKANCDAIYSELSDQIKSIIVQSQISYRMFGESTERTMMAYVFAPGQKEMTQFSFFSSAENRIAMDASGAIVSYWTRDRVTATIDSSAVYVDTSGAVKGGLISMSCMTRPIVNIPIGLKLYPTPNADSSYNIVWEAIS